MDKRTIVRKLQAVLQDAGIKQKLGSADSGKGSARYFLENDNKNLIKVHDGNHQTFGHIVFEEDEIYFCITLTTEISEEGISDISVRLHRLTKTDSFGGVPSIPILRAEWSKNDGTRMKYGQPHWQVGREINSNDETEKEENSPFEGEGLNTNFLSRFHFPICAQWLNNGDGECAHDTEVDAVCAWLYHCIIYIHRHVHATANKHRMIDS